MSTGTVLDYDGPHAAFMVTGGPDKDSLIKALAECGTALFEINGIRSRVLICSLERTSVLTTDWLVKGFKGGHELARPDPGSKIPKIVGLKDPVLGEFPLTMYYSTELRRGFAVMSGIVTGHTDFPHIGE